MFQRFTRKTQAAPAAAASPAAGADAAALGDSDQSPKLEQCAAKLAAIEADHKELLQAFADVQQTARQHATALSRLHLVAQNFGDRSNVVPASAVKPFQATLASLLDLHRQSAQYESLIDALQNFNPEIGEQRNTRESLAHPGCCCSRDRVDRMQWHSSRRRSSASRR